jgi:hypothetical protein
MQMPMPVIERPLPYAFPPFQNPIIYVEEEPEPQPDKKKKPITINPNPTPKEEKTEEPEKPKEITVKLTPTAVE